VKRFGTETMVHLYAVWLPDHTDALIHARVDAAKVATVSKAGSASIENGSTACPMLPDGRRSHGVHLMSQPSPADSFLSGDTPPSNSARALQALWWAARGSWDRAHSLVQHDGTEDAAWVHAHLHRVEGDLENANYWYRKAGRPSSRDALEAERTSIAAELLQRSTGSAESDAASARVV
jgi:TPR repeat protein